MRLFSLETNRWILSPNFLTFAPPRGLGWRILRRRGGGAFWRHRTAASDATANIGWMFVWCHRQSPVAVEVRWELATPAALHVVVTLVQLSQRSSAWHCTTATPAPARQVPMWATVHQLHVQPHPSHIIHNCLSSLQRCCTCNTPATLI